MIMMNLKFKLHWINFEHFELGRPWLSDIMIAAVRVHVLIQVQADRGKTSNVHIRLRDSDNVDMTQTCQWIGRGPPGGPGLQPRLSSNPQGLDFTSTHNQNTVMLSRCASLSWVLYLTLLMYILRYLRTSSVTYVSYVTFDGPKYV